MKMDYQLWLTQAATFKSKFQNSYSFEYVTDTDEFDKIDEVDDQYLKENFSFSSIKNKVALTSPQYEIPSWATSAQLMDLLSLILFLLNAVQGVLKLANFIKYPSPNIIIKFFLDYLFSAGKSVILDFFKKHFFQLYGVKFTEDDLALVYSLLYSYKIIRKISMISYEIKSFRKFKVEPESEEFKNKYEGGNE